MDRDEENNTDIMAEYSRPAEVITTKTAIFLDTEQSFVIRNTWAEVKSFTVLHGFS